MKKKTIRGAISSLILTLGLSTVAFADTMDMGKGTQKSVNGISTELSFNKDDKAIMNRKYIDGLLGLTY